MYNMLRTSVFFIIIGIVLLTSGCVNQTTTSYQPGDIVKNLQTGEFFSINSIDKEGYSIQQMSNIGEGKWQPYSDIEEKIPINVVKGNYSFVTRDYQTVTKPKELTPDPTQNAQPIITESETIRPKQTPTPISDKVIQFSKDYQTNIEKLDAMHDRAAHSYNAKDYDEAMKVTADDIWGIDALTLNETDEKSAIILKKFDYAKSQMKEYLQNTRSIAQSIKDENQHLTEALYLNLQENEKNYLNTKDIMNQYFKDYYNIKIQ